MGKCLRHKEEGSIRIRLGSLRRGRSKEGFAGPLVPSGASGDTLLGRGSHKRQNLGPSSVREGEQGGKEGSEQGAEWAAEWQEEPVRCARAPRKEAGAGLR